MERSLFFNSAPGDPRTYQASDFAKYFGDVLSSGLLHTNNIPAMEVKCQGNDLRTYVQPGKAIMEGYAYENTSDLYLEHALPEATLDRIDRIVLRLDKRNQSRFIKLFVSQGEPAEVPVAPPLQRDEFVHEFSLAQIRVRANTSALNAADLLDERLDESLCGIVSSLITIPTSQFLVEWNAWMQERSDDYNSIDIVTLRNDIDGHSADTNNPHAVTASQVGALPVNSHIDFGGYNFNFAGSVGFQDQNNDGEHFKFTENNGSGRLQLRKYNNEGSWVGTFWEVEPNGIVHMNVGAMFRKALVSAKRTVSKTLVSGSMEQIYFDEEFCDTTGSYANPYFTVPRTGRYRIHLFFSVDSMEWGQNLRASIIKNSTIYRHLDTYVLGNTTNVQYTSEEICNFAEGDVIHISIQSFSPYNETMNPGAKLIIEEMQVY